MIRCGNLWEHPRYTLQYNFTLYYIDNAQTLPKYRLLIKPNQPSQQHLGFPIFCQRILWLHNLSQYKQTRGEAQQIGWWVDALPQPACPLCDCHVAKAMLSISNEVWWQVAISWCQNLPNWSSQLHSRSKVEPTSKSPNMAMSYLPKLTIKVIKSMLLSHVQNQCIMPKLWSWVLLGFSKQLTVHGQAFRPIKNVM